MIAPTLDRLGWLRELTKGEWEPTQHAEVLGLIVDLAGGRFKASLEKLCAIKAMVQEHLLWCHTKWAAGRFNQHHHEGSPHSTTLPAVHISGDGLWTA